MTKAQYFNTANLMKKLSLLLPIFALAAFAGPATPDIAYDIVEGLTTEVGQRMPGTEAEARARDWGVKKLKSLGFSNVHIEEYQMPVWVRGIETAEVTAPFKQKLVLTALGNSAATPESGLEAQVIGFSTLQALIDAPDSMVRGKIVFVSHPMRATQDGSGYGAFGGARFVGPNIAAKKGAAAYLLRSLGTDNHRNPHTGVTRFEKGVAPIPCAALAIPDAENLQRMFFRSNGPVIVKLVLTPRQIGMQTSGNVVADVPGTDPNAGMIVIGGHLDSWDLGTGAIDDASGLAITTAAAKRIMDDAKPRRTIRVVWWGSEEVGGFGADAYYEAHKNDKIVFAGESDFGADKIWAYAIKLPESAKALAEKIKTELGTMGILKKDTKVGGGADVGKIIENGAWGIDLYQDGTRYFELHHTPDDTLDKIDPNALTQNVDAWEIVLRAIANAPDDLSPIKKPEPAK